MKKQTVTTPDFIIIGARRCGTNTAFRSLSRHPGISMRATEGWEIRYFTNFRDRGDDWYRSVFAPGQGVKGEKSPDYLGETWCHPHLARVCPDAKLIAFLRNPVDRAYSEYTFGRDHGWSGMPYGQYTFDELLRLAPNAQCFRHGLYADHLGSIFRHYPRERVHIEVSERFWGDIRGGFARLHQFLAVSPRTVNPDVRVAATVYGVPIASQAREALQAYYKPHNERLRALLGDDLPEWG